MSKNNCIHVVDNSSRKSGHFCIFGLTYSFKPAWLRLTKCSSFFWWAISMKARGFSSFVSEWSHYPTELLFTIFEIINCVVLCQTQDVKLRRTRDFQFFSFFGGPKKMQKVCSGKCLTVCRSLDIISQWSSWVSMVGCMQLWPVLESAKWSARNSECTSPLPTPEEKNQAFNILARPT